MTAARGRGRRDNGLPAALWSPLGDVDPRIGEHLLDLLRAADIAAYLEPSADVEPYTRSVSLPSPPADRLFVDRTRRTEARDLVDAHTPEDSSPVLGARATDRPLTESALLRREDAERRPGRKIDEDAEWARIVAAFEVEHGRPTVDERPVQAPPPPPHEIPVLDLPEEHFEPPPAPPVPAPSPSSLYAGLLIAGGLVLIAVPGVLRLSADAGLVLGVLVLAAGVALLVSRMRDRGEDDSNDDDGAVV